MTFSNTDSDNLGRVAKALERMAEADERRNELLELDRAERRESLARWEHLSALQEDAERDRETVTEWDATLPPLPDGMDAGAILLAALVDMTAAYHQERKHEGRWSKCQRPRCQNARLATEGRGPFAALATPTAAPER